MIEVQKDRKKIIHKRAYVPATYQKDYNQVILNKNDSPNNWKFISIKNAVLKEQGLNDEKSFHKKYGKEVSSIILENLIVKFALKNAEKVFATYGPHKPAKVLSDLIKKSKKTPTKVLHFKREGKGDFYLLNGRLMAFYFNKLHEIDGKKIPTQLLTDFWNDLSWDSLSNEGAVTLKNGKKPERLLQRLIELTTEEGEIVMDPFMGSGTTGAVSHKMGRRYIGIEHNDYKENSANQRLKNVIGGDSSGISKSLKKIHENFKIPKSKFPKPLVDYPKIFPKKYP